MVRQPIPCWNKTFLKKGTWSPEEDQKLIAYITRYGIWNWNEMPKYAGLSRSGKSCRLRWMNYLRPDIRRGNFTREEEETIVRLQKMLGNRWSAIAAMLPQRTDNDIKNYWNTRLKKRVENTSESASPTETTSSIEAEQENSFLELDLSIPTSEDLSEPNTYSFSPSGSSNTAVVDYMTYTMEDSFALSQKYWEFHSLLDNEDFQAMSPTFQLWLHEPIYLHESYHDPIDDFWASPFI